MDQIAVLWFQKSRVDQIKEGGRNTKYFHTSTIIRRRINWIDSLKDQDGVWQVEPETVKGLVVTHFKQLFTEECSELPRA